MLLQCLVGRDQPTAALDLPSLVLELSPSYEGRAEACEDMLQTYMFAGAAARDFSMPVGTEAAVQCMCAAARGAGWEGGSLQLEGMEYDLMAVSVHAAHPCLV